MTENKIVARKLTISERAEFLKEVRESFPDAKLSGVPKYKARSH